MRTICEQDIHKSTSGPCGPIPSGSWPMAYAPEISPVSALNRLAEWMRYNDRLTRELGDTGYRPRQRVFTSLQVELIFRYLGRP